MGRVELDFDKLYQWWVILGKPNREFIRSMPNEELPTSKGVLEAYLPLFVEESRGTKKKPIIIPNFDEKEESSIVVASDFHIPFEDKEAVRCFLNFLAEYQPDELVLNGNINDCTSFSTHPRIRELSATLKDGKEELKQWFKFADCLRELLPNTKITYIGSQCHEGWIDNWVQQSPILIEDERYTIPGWFRLDEYSIEYEPEYYDLLGNKELIITHGTVARSKGGNSAYATMEMEGTSIIQGHTHRLAQVYKTTGLGETVAIEGGCLCQRTPWYHLKGRRLMMDWQQGFVLVNTKGNSFSTQIIPIIRNDEDKPYFWIGKERYK